MTREEILALPPGRELDALVDRTVFGRMPCICGPIGGYDPHTGICSRCRGNPSPFYSTDIAAAWQVVEKLCRSELENVTGDCNDGCSQLIFSVFPGPGRWICDFWSADDRYVGHAEADTAPHAICLAALLAVERG